MKLLTTAWLISIALATGASADSCDQLVPEAWVGTWETDAVVRDCGEATPNSTTSMVWEVVKGDTYREMILRSAGPGWELKDCSVVPTACGFEFAATFVDSVESAVMTVEESGCCSFWGGVFSARLEAIVTGPGLYACLTANYLEVECDEFKTDCAISVGPTTWGQIKSLYRK